MRKFAITMLLLLPVLALLVSCSEQGVPEPVYVDVDAKSKALKLVNIPNNFKYACLTSSEYGQAYLPKGYECYDCEISEKHREILNRDYREDKILLLIRVNNKFIVSDVDLNKIMGLNPYTSYTSVAYNSEDFGEYSQCTSNINENIWCYRYLKSCLLMFVHQK